MSGQVPINKFGSLVSTSIEDETEAVFANLAAVLRASGSSLNKVLKVTVFLTHMEDFARMNSVFEKHFSVHKPARSCVAVRELPRGVSVVIECIAVEDSAPGKTPGETAEYALLSPPPPDFP